MNIETRETQNIPLSLLAFSKSNMRSAKKIDDEFVNSIKHNGIVQALVVTKIGEKYEVVGGRRRLLALNALLKMKEIDKSYSVPCTLCSQDTAARLSIIENLHRSTPHATEYYVSINRLKEEGGSRESICNYLQLTTLKYDQIIRLANLHPRIFKAYEKDELDEKQVKAFGATNDIKKQIDIWKQSDYSNSITAYTIRTALQTGLTNNDRLVKFVGIDRYTKAGGTLTPDLFTDIVLIHDAHLVMDLATRLLSAALEKCRTEEPGWKWYKATMPGQQDTVVETKGRFYGKTRRTTGEQKSRIKLIDDELKLLIAIDEEDWTHEQAERYDELDEKHDDLLIAIQQENSYYLKKEMNHSGIVISFNTHGELYYTRGVQTSDDIAGMKKKANKPDGAGDTGSEGSDDGDDTDSPYSQALSCDIDLYLRAMTKAQLVKYPDMAIELLHYSLVVSSFESWPPMIHSLNTQITAVETTQNDYEQSTMCRVLTDARNKLDLEWLNLEEQKARIDAYISLPDKSKKALLAFVSASAFQEDLDDFIRTETALDVTEYWSPTKENYFSRIARPLLLTQVIHIVGDKAAAPYLNSTKKRLVDYISGLFDEKPNALKAVLEKWVPPLFK